VVWETEVPLRGPRAENQRVWRYQVPAETLLLNEYAIFNAPLIQKEIPTAHPTFWDKFVLNVLKFVGYTTHFVLHITLL